MLLFIVGNSLVMYYYDDKMQLRYWVSSDERDEPSTTQNLDEYRKYVLWAGYKILYDTGDL